MLCFIMNANETQDQRPLARTRGAAGEDVRVMEIWSVRRPAVGCIAWLGLGFVANHFDVVPVRTNDESCIVVRVVFRAQTRRTIVFATRLQTAR